MSKQRDENPELVELVRELRQAIYDPEKGILVRLTKIETTLSNLKWLVPLGSGIALIVVQLALKAVGFL